MENNINHNKISLTPAVQLSHADVELAVVEKLIELGWSRLDSTPIANKTFRTAVGNKVAHVYLSKGDEYNRRLSGIYESKGSNILGNKSVLIPHGTDMETCLGLVAEFAANAEAAIADSYAVRLLRPD